MAGICERGFPEVFGDGRLPRRTIRSGISAAAWSRASDRFSRRSWSNGSEPRF
jgi:hypothetical protein